MEDAQIIKMVLKIEDTFFDLTSGENGDLNWSSKSFIRVYFQVLLNEVLDCPRDFCVLNKISLTKYSLLKVNHYSGINKFQTVRNGVEWLQRCEREAQKFAKSIDSNSKSPLVYAPFIHNLDLSSPGLREQRFLKAVQRNMTIFEEESRSKFFELVLFGSSGIMFNRLDDFSSNLLQYYVNSRNIELVVDMIGFLSLDIPNLDEAFVESPNLNLFELFAVAPTINKMLEENKKDFWGAFVEAEQHIQITPILKVAVFLRGNELGLEKMSSENIAAILGIMD